jgi:L-amino acid N-acyltransferase YncA
MVTATSIRDATADDAAGILPIYNDAVVNTTAVFDFAPRSLAAQQAWLTGKREQDLPVLVAEQDGQVVGFCSFGPFRPWPAYAHTVENAIYIAPDRRGTGIGTQLLTALLGRARQRDLHAIVAGITADNQASLRLHARFGYQPVAHFREVGRKFDRWLDLVFLELLL